MEGAAGARMVMGVGEGGGWNRGGDGKGGQWHRRRLWLSRDAWMVLGTLMTYLRYRTRKGPE